MTDEKKQDMLDRKLIAGERWFDKLFAAAQKDPRSMIIVLLIFSTFHFIRKSDNKEAENQLLQKEAQINKEIWVERVIKEVEKRQDPRFKTMENKIDTVRMVNDSSAAKISATTDVIRTVVGKVEKSLKRK